jgi:hypothetical protein
VATRVYFPVDTPTTVSPAAAAWTDTTQITRLKMTTTKGATAITLGSAIAVPGPAGQNALDRQYISDPIATGTDFTGATVKGYLMVEEAQTADNVDQLISCIKVVSEDGSTLRATLLALGANGTVAEFTTTNGGRNKAIANGDALSAYTTVAGDRLVIELGYGCSTLGSSPNAWAAWGDTGTDVPENETNTTAGPGWVEFSNTFTFVAPSSTQAPRSMHQYRMRRV